LQTDRTFPNNKPDIIIDEKLNGTRMLIDVANLGDRNVIIKRDEEILKYINLAKEIQRFWDAHQK